jgi:hypothetical protein
MQNHHYETMKAQECTLDAMEQSFKAVRDDVDREIRRHVNNCLQKCMQLRTAIWDVRRELTAAGGE